MRVITLNYRKLINAGAEKQWDKLVFDDSFTEFKMQAQNYSRGTGFTTYAKLLHHVPNANRLAGMVTPAITGYVQQLNSIMPDILNNLGRRFLKFDKFQLEIINSDINDQSKHQVAINFYSEPMIWHDTVDNYMLLSEYQLSIAPEPPEGEILTNLMQIQPYLNIYSIKNIA